MKILSVSQHKGGVGKTSVCKLLAIGLAMRGLRVLIVDLDSQCNLSKLFLDMHRDPSLPNGSSPPVHPDYDPNDPENDGWDGISSSAGFFNGGEIWPYPTAIANLDILPGAGEELTRVELVTEDDLKGRVAKALREFLRSEQVTSTYQVVILDTPPTKGPLVQAAMHAATHVVVPAIMEPNCITGLEGMMGLWRGENRIRELDDTVELIGILPNMIRPIALHTGLLEGLREDVDVGPLVLPTSLGQRAAFAESDHDSARPGSVFTLPASNLARREAEAVVEHVAQKLGVAA